LLSLLRNLVVAKVVKEPEPLLDLPDEEARDVKQLVSSADADDLSRLYHGFSQGFDDVVKTERPRMALEMLLVRLARRPPLLPIDDFVARLSALERRLGGGGPAPQPPQRQPPPQRPPHDSAAAEQQGYAGRPREPRSPAPPSKAQGDDRGGEPPVGPRPALNNSNARPVERERPRPAPSPRGPEPEPEPASQSVDELDQIYTQILAILEAERPDLAAMLSHAIPLRMMAESVVIGWPPDAMLVASDKESVATLQRAADKHFGKPCAVSFEFDSARASGRKSLAAADSQERAERTRAAYAAAQKHERITEAVEVLGAKLKELKLGVVA
jgi:DNA polymerase III subunit gamma/tau